MATTHTHPNTTVPGGETSLACSACAHPWAEHDQIAARFCTATMVGHHDRGCVCSVVPKPGGTQAN
ncbi:RGCVC family protein [Actinophytocola sp.]|uniref:RGCVC family protein n=1 Tax=Actinophytocola sp. TaxID=1872138 RepID=UPI002D2DB40C|nr:RGCVC family protein [Actinophytocola sp.]HYQ65242.1 RGCVC family protein [Actinophytocola sp.]